MNNTFEHKGYHATISDISFEDGTLLAATLDMAEEQSFSSDSVVGLISIFHVIVDEYLTKCEQEGAEPTRPFSGKFIVRVPAGLHRQCALEAARLGLSLNAFVTMAMNKAVGNVK